VRKLECTTREDRSEEPCRGWDETVVEHFAVR
jgi:hypothetical protein